MRIQSTFSVVVALLTACFSLTSPRLAGAADVAVKANTQFEVITRGPVHEGFATQFQINPVAGVAIEKAPPKPIEELPPTARPIGANIQWLPGYWGWDGDAKDFLWVSGTYRNLPPGHRWLPGYWNQANDGYQWMSGCYLGSNVKEIKYYSAPPQSVERGPTSEAPSKNHFWISGSYQPTEGRYAWRPGYWSAQNENYVWCPARNVLTARGYIYAPGYWDYRLSQRGTLFAPVRLAAGANVNAALRLTPSVIIPATALQFHLFSQVNSATYLFGDYYGEQYAQLGIRPWYATEIVAGVPDPLFGYSAWYFGRTGVNYLDVMTRWNTHFATHVALRPALTLASQVDLVARVGVKDVANSILAVNLSGVTNLAALSLVSVSAVERAAFITAATSLRLLAVQRVTVETGVGGVLNVAGNVSGAVNVAAQALVLPAVPVTVSGVVGVAGVTTSGIGSTVNGVTYGVLPGVTNGLVPGVTNGLVPGVTNGVVPGVLNNGPLDLGGGLGGGDGLFD